MSTDIDLTKRGPRLDYGQSLVNFYNETASLHRWNVIVLGYPRTTINFPLL